MKCSVCGQEAKSYSIGDRRYEPCGHIDNSEGALRKADGAHILAYLAYVKQHYPKSRFLFPSVHVVFGLFYAVDETKAMEPQQVWRIVKQLNARAWPHLFRETRAAEVVKRDETIRGEASLETVYRVKRALDLERETTAWNYINRFATEKIEEEEEIAE